MIQLISNRHLSKVLPLIVMAGSAISVAAAVKDKTPNILFIMSDDHTSQAISVYGEMLAKVLPTPNIDRIANEGAILKKLFCHQFYFNTEQGIDHYRTILSEKRYLLFGRRF